MAELNVIFDVPLDILEGLKNGTLERVGGVIRRVDGKKPIVMWLQEGVLLERDTAEQLLKQGGEQIQLLRQQTELLAQLGVQQQMMMGLQVANLAVSVAGFALLYYKLDGIQKTLGSMDAKLDKLQQGQDWLDTKQLLSHLAPIQAALAPIREARLYGRSDLLEQQLLHSDGRFAEARSYFHHVIHRVFDRGQEFVQTRELEVAYRAWVMTGQGQLQVMSSLGEQDVAHQRAAQLKSEHTSLGQLLQARLSDPLHRMGVGAIGTQNQPLLLSMARHAVGVQEILSGNLLQLDYMREHRLQLPQAAPVTDHKGLVMYRVA